MHYFFLRFLENILHCTIFVAQIKLNSVTKIKIRLYYNKTLLLYKDIQIFGYVTHFIISPFLKKQQQNLQNLIFGVFLHIVCNGRNYFFHHIIIFFLAGCLNVTYRDFSKELLKSFEIEQRETETVMSLTNTKKMSGIIRIFQKMQRKC